MKTKKKRAKLDAADPVGRVLNDDSGFATIETYKAIRTKVMFSMPKTDKGKIIVVTSPAPGEGKTTTAINLSITFAQTGAKVVLLDCDLRKSRVHRYLGVDRKTGISNVLCGFSELDAAIQRNVRENLDVLPAGEIPPNPAELMESREFARMLGRLQSQYDYIFIDTPPITVVTDAALAIKYSAGVVMVARQNVTTFDLMDAAMNTLRTAKAKILGVILVGVEEKSRRYGYYKNRYGYKYGYRYGYKYGYGYGYKYEDNKRETNG